MIRGTGIDSTVKLYLKGNGANASTKFFDDSQSHKTVTPFDNAQISTAQSKFGGSSIYLDGTGDYLSIPASSDWNYGDKFSISFWFRTSNKNVNERIFSHGANDLSVFKSAIGELYIVYDGVTSYIITNTYSTNTWYYLAIIYDTGTLKVYLDGVLKVNQSGLSNIDESSNPFLIGQVIDIQYYTGYIDEFIIQKGVAIDGTKVPTRQRG